MKKIATGLLAGTAALGGLYVLSTQGRTGHPGLGVLKRFKYAHRGLHDEQKPENSMAAFRAALEQGYGIEFDIHLLKDGNLAVIHDTSLLRTTGQEGTITDLTTEDLCRYRLNGTEETIPTFRQVLDTFAGKTPIIIELKPNGGNCAALCEAACKAMAGYEGVWCMESFDPRAVYWLRKNRPDIIRGQLSENYLRKPQNKLPLPLKFLLAFHLENFLCRPDFIAYDFYTRKVPSNPLCRKLWGLEAVTWTVRTPEDHRIAEKEGWITIFENYTP